MTGELEGEGEVPWPVLCKMISCSALESVHILSHCHDRQAAESLSQSLASAQLQSVGKISEISEISEIRDQRSDISLLTPTSPSSQEYSL